jgi:hypothetical protein
MEWLPIETAPRDGSWVLLKGGDSFEPTDSGRLYPCVSAWWNADWEEWVFVWFDSAWRGTWEAPTHWMPIPA